MHYIHANDEGDEGMRLRGRRRTWRSELEIDRPGRRRQTIERA
jgi:hypothetical protein